MYSINKVNGALTRLYVWVQCHLTISAHERGQGLVEFALILFMVVVVLAVVITLFAPSIGQILPTALHLNEP